MYIRPLAYPKNHMFKFHEIFRTYYLWRRLDPDNNAIRYVLPVLSMTSWFHIMVGTNGYNQRRPLFRQSYVDLPT